MARQLARGLFSALAAIALGAFVGPLAAIGAAIALVTFAFGDYLQPVLDRLKVSMRAATWAVVLLGLGIVGVDLWRHFYEPYRIAQGIMLIERDPESWPGHTYAEGPFRLDERIDPPLEIQVEERRRFNPQVQISRDAVDVFGVTAFLYFPKDGFSDALEVPAPWQITEDRTGRWLIFYDDVGDYAKGDGGLPEIAGAWFITPKRSGTFELEYGLNGRAAKGEPFPVRRKFKITVKP